DGGRLDASRLALGLLEPLDFVAVLLRPARIHAKKHAGPILALGTARAGMNFDIRIIGVGLAREERFELAPRDFRLELLQRRFRLGDGLLVFLGLAELDHGELIVELLLDAANGGQLLLERGALLHHALGALLIVPQRGVFRLLVEFGKPRARLVDVKDASSAARWTA